MKGLEVFLMDMYGIIKHIATENYYVAFSKCVNSAVCTEETLQTIKRITLKNIQFAHMGQLIIHEGICYASFIQNPGDDGELHSSITSGIVLEIGRAHV